MVVLIDRTADGAQRIVAVGQNIRHGKLFKVSAARRLNNADIGDIMRGKRVEAQSQIFQVCRGVVRFQNAVSNGFFPPCRKRLRRGSRKGSAAVFYGLMNSSDHTGSFHRNFYAGCFSILQYYI